MARNRKPRLLVFVIAYHAEDTLTSVLERIPRSIFNEYDCEMYLLYKAIVLGYRIAEVPASKIYPPWKLSYTKMRAFSGWWKMLRAFFYLRLGLKD